MKKPPEIGPLVEGYFAYLSDVQRRARRTVIDVRCSLRRVIGLLEDRDPDRPLWKLRLEDFLWWIEREREQNTSPQTLSKYISHVRGLLDYAWRCGRCERNVLDGFQLQDVKRPVEPACLTEEEAHQLVQACPARSAAERRDRLMVLLLYGCGLRTKELCALRLQDVDRDRQEVFVRYGKGERQRTVPIPDAVYVPLLAYLTERGGRRGPLFFTAHHRRPISSKDVTAVVRHAAQQAGLQQPVTPKVLRHSFATHLMDRGVDLAVIASLMGHRSPAETGVYLHVLGDRSEAAVRCLASRSNNKEQTS